MTSSHSSSVMLTSTRSRRMPALLIRMSRSPNVSMAVLTSCSAPSQSEKSSSLATASPPRALISSTTCWAGRGVGAGPVVGAPRSFTTTFAPSAANSRACSRPRPRPAPVMIATRPSSAPMVGPFVAPAGNLASQTLPSSTAEGRRAMSARRQEGHVDGRPALELRAGRRRLALDRGRQRRSLGCHRAATRSADLRRRGRPGPGAASCRSGRASSPGRRPSTA